MAALFAPEGIEKFTTALTKGGTKSAQYIELLKHVSSDTAKEMVTNLQKGGKKAEDTFIAISGVMGDGYGILDQLSTGAVKGKDVMQQVITELNNIDDKVYRNTLGVELFGTQWEDLEQEVISALGSTQNQFDMTKSTMEDMAAVKYDNLTQELKVLGRELMDDVIIPIGEDLMPVLKDMTEWAKDNKDVIKAIGLAVPAAVLAKNTAGIAKDFGKVGKAVFDTSGGVSKFGKVLGLMTNPVGIAVGAVGALSLGVMAYKKHQEAARQELLNMGDALDQAFDDYSGVEEQTQKTKDLITEYDRLTKKIGDVKTPAEELTEARRKLGDVEQDLIDLNPDILKAEDAKSGKFREQLGLADKLNDTRSEMQRRELEQNVMEGEADLPELKKEYGDLTNQLFELNGAYQEAKKSYTQYSDYVNQHQAIVDDKSLSYDQVNKKLDELASKVKAETGLDYGNNFANMILDAQEAKEAIDENYDSWKKTQEEILASEDSFQSLYDTKKKLIEQDLGASIDEQAAKYKNLSSEEKLRFDEAMRNISELNQAMDTIPDAKKVDISVVWQQTGAVPAATHLKKMELRDPGFEGYADGGIATKPSIFGEAGPEIAIPLNNKPRSQGLLDTANRLMGSSGGALGAPASGNFAPVFNPQIVIQGNANEQMVRTVMNDSQRNWEQNMATYKRQQERRNLA